MFAPFFNPNWEDTKEATPKETIPTAEQMQLLVNLFLAAKDATVLENVLARGIIEIGSSDTIRVSEPFCAIRKGVYLRLVDAVKQME